MPRPALATLDQLAAATNTSPPQAQAQSLLERASAIVRAFCGETWLNHDGILSGVPDDVPGVVVGMVERATRNPDGLVSETTGPFGVSWGPDAAQRLYLTAMDKLVLRAAVGATGLGTVTITRGPSETAAVDDWAASLPSEVRW